MVPVGDETGLDDTDVEGLDSAPTSIRPGSAKNPRGTSKGDPLELVKVNFL